MTDLRLCKICDRTIDVEAPGMKVFSGRRLLVIDPSGNAHSFKRSKPVVTAPSATEEKDNDSSI